MYPFSLYYSLPLLICLNDLALIHTQPWNKRWILQCNYFHRHSLVWIDIFTTKLYSVTVIFSRFYKQPKLLNTCKTIRRFERDDKILSLSPFLSIPSINQRGVLLSFHSGSDSHFLHFHPNGEVAKAGKRTARQGMLRDLIVSRAFERSDFTATVFSNDFPPLKASHPLSFLFHPPSLFLSLPLTSKVDGLVPPPAPRRCPPARILLRGREERGRGGRHALPE